MISHLTAQKVLAMYDRHQRYISFKVLDGEDTHQAKLVKNVSGEYNLYVDRIGRVYNVTEVRMDRHALRIESLAEIWTTEVEA